MIVKLTATSGVLITYPVFDITGGSSTSLTSIVNVPGFDVARPSKTVTTSVHCGSVSKSRGPTVITLPSKIRIHLEIKATSKTFVHVFFRHDGLLQGYFKSRFICSSSNYVVQLYQIVKYRPYGLYFLIKSLSRYLVSR